MLLRRRGASELIAGNRDPLDGSDGTLTCGLQRRPLAAARRKITDDDGRLVSPLLMRDCRHTARLASGPGSSLSDIGRSATQRGNDAWYREHAGRVSFLGARAAAW